MSDTSVHYICGPHNRLLKLEGSVENIDRLLSETDVGITLGQIVKVSSSYGVEAEFMD